MKKNKKEGKRQTHQKKYQKKIVSFICTFIPYTSTLILLLFHSDVVVFSSLEGSDFSTNLRMKQ